VKLKNVVLKIAFLGGVLAWFEKGVGGYGYAYGYG
jgi:hypothetical protein